MLADTAFIQEQYVRTYNKKIDRQHPHKEKGKTYFMEPLYDQHDVDKVMSHFVCYDYDRRFRLFDDVLLTFDETRAKRAMRLLLELARERQILMFTCSGREEELLREIRKEERECLPQ